MQAVEIKPNIYWVGGIDWDIRNFHGYQTPRGTTYNAYLIKDEQTVLIDTVKNYMFDEMLERIQSVVNPKDIDLIISNHVEMDHSGCLPHMQEIAPNAMVLTSTNGEKGLTKHYHSKLNIEVVSSGSIRSIGKRTLQFFHIPMVHWPDSMVTYSPKDHLLFPNDAFGQHLASSQRFDDNFEWGILREEAAKYYANIVMPYGDQVIAALKATQNLSIDMIAPSHGIIWRSHIPQIISEYKQWASYASQPKAVIIYDSMWGSTKKLAQVLFGSISKQGIPVCLRNLSTTHYSDIVTDILDAQLICFGSPTLNNGMMPSMGGFLTYLVGLRPRKKIGFVFGSYGWGGQAVGAMKAMLEPLSWEFPVEQVKVSYVPTDKDIDSMIKKGKELVNYIKKDGVATKREVKCNV